jgi:hypothetical protein
MQVINQFDREMLQRQNFGAGSEQFEGYGALDTSRRPGNSSDRVAQAHFYWLWIAGSSIA